VCDNDPVEKQNVLQGRNHPFHSR